MARLGREDHKNVTVLHPWRAPRLDLTAVFCPETSTSDFFFFRRRNQTFILEDKLNVFFDRANNWLLREKRFYRATLFYLFRGRNRVYIVSGVSVQIKPLRPFVRFKMVIFAFQNITNCNVEIILSLTSVSFGSESLG